MIFLTIVLLSIIIGYPIWDSYFMKKGDFSNKIKMYLTIIISQWIIVAILFIFWSVTNRSFSDLFNVREPILSYQMENLKLYGLGALIALGIYVLLFLFSKKLKTKLLKYKDDQLDAIRFMLPSTLVERLLFVLVAMTAGFCEEFVFRGVMLSYFENLPVQLSVFTIAIIMSFLFGIVHLYQGWKGVLSTTYIGGILLYIYLVTGNLWLCIIIHFLFDVRFAFSSNKSNLVEENTNIQI
jgi:membrane protease YdiL (CAAX protease family)